MELKSLPQRQKRRPLGLDLDNPSRPFLPAEAELDAPTNACDICSKSLVPNPHLCEDCQIWNDVRHVFRCLQDIAEWEKHAKTTLEMLLDRKECFMCQMVTHAVLKRFAGFNESMQENLYQIEIKSFGPFCQGESMLSLIDSDYMKRIGRLQIDENDLRLSPTLDIPVREDKSGEMVIPVILYVVVTAPLGFSLHPGTSELDRHTSLLDAQATRLEFEAHRIMPSGGPGLLQPTIGVQVELQYKNSFTQLLKIMPWEDPYIDVALISKWISTCEAQHRTKCGLKKDDTNIPRGFKAIDTLSLCVVELASSPLPRYATLSYTWGASTGAKELQLERSNVNSLSQAGALMATDGIPDLILDAIQLCGEIGERYLWVDRLCIIQDDPASKHSQIQAMDRIYSLARFTIIAAVSPGVGLPGVVNRPRKPSLWNHTRRFHNKMRIIGDNFFETAMKSFWNTRGWTYQERLLSRRAIYITEFEAYFLCEKGAEQEKIGEFAAAINFWDYGNLALYRATVADYTARNLSFAADILNAFAGIGNQFAKAQGAPLLYGLPEKYFSQALLWEPWDEENINRDIGRRMEAPDIPTWSWAAWKGRTRYDLNSRVEKVTFGTLVRFYFQDPIHGLRLVKAEEMWFIKNVQLEALKNLPSVDEEYPEMRFMPSADVSTSAWHQCPHNPWEVSKRALDEDMQNKLSAIPGSLVFVTTLARLELHHKPPLESQAYPTASMLDILDKKGDAVGQMAISDPTWMEGNSNPKEKHDFIVIAAGILSEPSRYTHSFSFTHVSGEIRSPRKDESPWYLHVMLIKQNHQTGVAQRLSIGVVEMQAWRHCEPQWSTIILA